MPRLRLCILSLAPVHQDGRVLRQIEYAAREYDVTVVGWGHLDKPRPTVRMKPVTPWSFSRPQRLIQAALMLGGRATPAAWERWYWRKPDHREALRLVTEEPCDLIHVDEAIALPIAVKAATGLHCKIVFDAHEYSPDQHADKLWWRIVAQPFYTYLFQRYAPHVNAMTTVAEGIAERYRREFGLEAAVIMSAPLYTELPFHPVEPGRVRIIHHGAAMRNRHLEEMIETVTLADPRFSLEFMLVGSDAAYIEELKQKARISAADRITFRSPVSPQEIPETINAYDIGLFLLPPVNFNRVHALPNKLFEFIMAGLAIAIGPSPEMARIVRAYRLGIVADTFEPADLAQRLNALTPEEINAMKRHSLNAAKRFSADAEMGKLLAIYRRVLAEPGC